MAKEHSTFWIHGIFRNKKGKTIDVCNNLEETWRSYAEWIKLTFKYYTLCNSLYITSPKEKNNRYGEGIIGCPMVKTGERVVCDNKMTTWRYFCGDGIALYLYLSVFIFCSI